MSYGVHSVQDEEAIEWIHAPKQRAHKQISKTAKHLKSIETKVNKIQNTLLKEQLRRSSDKIIELIDMEEEEEKKVFFVNFSKGQSNDLEKFIKILDEGCQKKWSTSNMTLRKVNEDDIMGILLKVYTYIEEGDGSPIIFLIQRITNFDYKDIPILHKSLDKGHYSIVIPTYKSLIEIDSMNYTGFYHMILYNHKQLFVQFMMSAVMDSQLKAYLPSQILQLISDLDYYPISYREGVRRFCVSLKRLYLVNKGDKFVSVEFENLYNSLVEVLRSCMPRGDVKIEDRFIKTVLDKDYVFKIPKSMVDMVVIKEQKDQQTIDYSNLDRIAKKLKKKLQSDPSLSKFSHYVQKLRLEQQQVNYNSSKNSKRDRMSILNIPKAPLSKHQLLNEQITKIIKEATEKIRSQAATIPWQKIKYDEYCRPELMKKICEDIRSDAKLNKIFSVTQQYIETYHKDNFSNTSLKIAQYHYMMTQLEFLGVIENSKKQIDPTFFNQVYKKTDFRIS